MTAAGAGCLPKVSNTTSERTASGACSRSGARAPRTRPSGPAEVPVQCGEVGIDLGAVVTAPALLEQPGGRSGAWTHVRNKNI